MVIDKNSKPWYPIIRYWTLSPSTSCDGSHSNLIESATFSGVIYNVLKSVPGIYSPLPIKYSPIEPKSEGGSFTGLTVALNDTDVESIPPFKTPPSSFTVTVIIDEPNWFSFGIKASCSEEDSKILISVNKSVLSAEAVIVIFWGLTSPP